MLSIAETLRLIGRFALKRLKEQISAVALIVGYLICFQVFILDLPIVNALKIGLGLGLVVIGLAFFMEGLNLGLMPLGELIGVKLPQKAKLWFLMLFSFILGIGATFAEPAIGVLKQAGAAVKAWEAPLLFFLLNYKTDMLVLTVGLGVGFAVACGMLRFIYNWSLKPFIYVFMGTSILTAIWGLFEPNLEYLTGLAWDCGAVTTGPVTVPLVLALGIGISRVVGKGDGGGFGVVTLASACPILAVTILGLSLLPQTPNPMSQEDFFLRGDKKVKEMFPSDEHFVGYMLQNSTEKIQLAYFGNDQSKMGKTLLGFYNNAELAKKGFGGKKEFEQWLLHSGSQQQKLAVFASYEKIAALTQAGDARDPAYFDRSLILRNILAASQAILPLVIFLLLVLYGIIRNRLQKTDEVCLGVAFAILGMSLFSIGIETGLASIGNQVGNRLASSYRAISLDDAAVTIEKFDPSLVQTSIGIDGKKSKFFYLEQEKDVKMVPFQKENFQEQNKHYYYTPKHGPLFGKEDSFFGIIVVILFAFIMGYGATLAEPALNALGNTVEKITVGVFKKSLLMQAVAVGVGVGISLGISKIIWDLPLVYLIVPPYAVLLFITYFSTEEFVNIGWDSAGVTTGPITVPLVLALGLGIGGQSGVVEGFGILSMASVCPILSVLLVGMYVTRKRLQRVKKINEKNKDKNAQLKAA